VRAAAVVVAACWLATGCGPPPTVTATGTVVRSGKVIPLSKTGVIQVTLKPDVPADQQFTTITGRTDASGNFSIPGVPPGRYIIGIEQLDPNPMSDKLDGALTYGNSKIKRDIDGKTPIKIDLAKPE
jgi:hypothetical protein